MAEPQTVPAGPAPPPDIAVVVVGGRPDDTDATLRALADQRLGGLAVEAILVRAWPSTPPRFDVQAPPARPALRVVDVAVSGAGAAANAGLAACRAPRALLLAAGDIPASPDLVARHAEVHAAQAPAAVLGALAGGVRAHETWVGLRPAAGPPPGRHVSLERRALARLDGLDERLHDLDVAVLELALRFEAARLRTIHRPDLVVRAAAAGLAATEEAGRSAQALDALLSERDGATAVVGPPRARPLLRWAAGALRLAAASPLPDHERLVRLAHRAAFARGRGRPPLPVHAGDRGGLVPEPETGAREPVAVVVPFAGDAVEAADLLDALEELALRAGDELVVVDNSRRPVVERRGRARVVRADAEHSSYHARNAGARATRAPWLLFVDADCRPVPWILDAFFAPAPGPGVGAVAGAVLSSSASAGWIERYSDVAGVLSQTERLAHRHLPYAVTANLLVRRSAFELVGGFAEGVRSSGDVDFSWRLQAAGLQLDYRPRAAVAHVHRSTVTGLLRQYRRYGGGTGWISRRYPDAADVRWRPHLSMLRTALLDVAAGRFELAATRVLTFSCAVAALTGRFASNRPPARPRPDRRWHAVAVADRFPDATDPGPLQRVATLAADGAVAVEARHRPVRIACDHAAAAVAYLEDDAPLDRLAALLALARSSRGIAALARAAGDSVGPDALVAGAAAAERSLRRRPDAVLALDDRRSTATRARLLATVADAGRRS